jgi:hypothetical protein
MDEKLFSEGNDKGNMETSRVREVVQSCFSEFRNTEIVGAIFEPN